eukprot:COSAG02_NODE_603_length_19693_cov_3.883944_8_plen_180_part_00
MPETTAVALDAELEAAGGLVDFLRYRLHLENGTVCVRTDDFEAAARLVRSADSERYECGLVAGVKVFAASDNAPIAGPGIALRKLGEPIGFQPFARHVAQVERRRTVAPATAIVHQISCRSQARFVTRPKCIYKQVGEVCEQPTPSRGRVTPIRAASERDGRMDGHDLELPTRMRRTFG